jgi:hypothetical protein
MEFERQTNEIAEISQKYGHVHVRCFRMRYGSFAPHCADHETLQDVLWKLDIASLTQLICDYNSGELDRIFRDAA